MSLAHKRPFAGISPEQLAAAIQTSHIPTENAAIQQASLGLVPRTVTRGWNARGEVEKRGLVDYLRFTVKEPEHLDWYLKRFGGAPDNWKAKDRGFYGYRKSHWCGNIAIFSDGGEEGMGFCVQLSGEGCREFEQSFSERSSFSGWEAFFALLCVTLPGDTRPSYPGTVSVTRLDVALDDFTGELDLEKIKGAAKGRDYSCRGGVAFTEGCKINESRPRGSDDWGITVEFGRKSSSQMMRFYDKAAQKRSLGASGEGHWVRAEYQANGERAALLASCLASAGLACVPGIMRSYIEFKEANTRGEKHKRNALAAAWWEKFLGGWDKLVLSLSTPERSFFKLRSWFDRQVLPGLAVLFDASMSGKTLLAELVQDGRERLKPYHLDMIRRERLRVASAGVNLAGELVPASGPTGF